MTAAVPKYDRDRVSPRRWHKFHKFHGGEFFAWEKTCETPVVRLAQCRQQQHARQLQHAFQTTDERTNEQTHKQKDIAIA